MAKWRRVKVPLEQFVEFDAHEENRQFRMQKDGVGRRAEEHLA